MKKKSSLTRKTHKGLALKSKQKDWVKKLEEASGKPVDFAKKARYVYLLVDCSYSMDEGNKLRQAKNGSIAFSKEAIEKGYSIGLITFAGSAKLILEPQRDLTILQEKITRLSTYASTNITAALRLATDKLATTMGERVICLMTDGEPYPPDTKASAIEMAKTAYSQGIDIMTIGTDDADWEFLRALSTRNKLSIKVERHQLAQGIASMAKMLPGN